MREQLQQAGQAASQKHRLASTAWRTKSTNALDAQELKAMFAPQTMTGNQLSPAMQSLAINEVSFYLSLYPQTRTSPKLSLAMQFLAIAEVPILLPILISPDHGQPQAQPRHAVPGEHRGICDYIPRP